MKLLVFYAVSVFGSAVFIALDAGTSWSSSEVALMFVLGVAEGLLLCELWKLSGARIVYRRRR